MLSMLLGHVINFNQSNSTLFQHRNNYAKLKYFYDICPSLFTRKRFWKFLYHIKIDERDFHLGQSYYFLNYLNDSYH